MYNPKHHISTIKSGEEIFIQRCFAGFSVNYRCKFIGYSRGMVSAIIEESNYHPRRSSQELNLQAGAAIKARPSSCYLKGSDGECEWIKGSWKDI